MELLYDARNETVCQVDRVVSCALSGEKYSIFTSGTTGTPKEHKVDLSGALNKKRPGDSNERWLLMYQPSRWAGVSVVLHALKSDCTLCIPDQFSFAGLLSAAATYKPTHLACTPSMFRNLILHDKEEILVSLPVKQITFGGEVATQGVLDLAKLFWPLARVSHVYASTELGDICSVSDGLAGIPAYKFESYSIEEGGELVIGELRTGDLWERNNDRFYFCGRISDIINVGGNKVYPITIEDFALSQGAKAAKAYAIPSPLMGSLVGLDFVGDLDTTSLLISYRKVFPKYMCPATINKVESIEITSAGKIKRS